MKKQKKYLLIISLFVCAGCGKQDYNAVSQPEPTTSESVATTSPTTSNGTQAPTEYITVSTTPSLYEQSVAWDDVDDEIIPDLGDTKGILQFINDDILFLAPGETLPLYAIDIRRDSTYQYLLQVGMEDVTVLEYIDDSLEKTVDSVSLQYHMPEYPEYDLYMEYSVNGAYWNFALIVR